MEEKVEWNKLLPELKLSKERGTITIDLERNGLLDSLDEITFFHYPATEFKVSLKKEKDGYLRFTLTTEEGEFKVSTDVKGVSFHEKHRMAIQWNDATKEMQLMFDKRQVYKRYGEPKIMEKITASLNGGAKE